MVTRLYFHRLTLQNQRKKTNLPATNDREKVCAIHPDEVAYKASVLFNPLDDQVEGFEDFRQFGRSPKHATHALGVILKGFSTNHLRICLVAQVLGHRVAAGISAMVTLEAQPPQAIETAKFAEQFDRLFQCFNSSDLKSKKYHGTLNYPQFNTHHLPKPNFGMAKIR
ncbi:hypothetical protein PoB_001042400 [Plakobranchus ocellatus]|uniref:Transposable element P transposase-like GTP-binding insertion domain-containing protein n=1 Tax=Plakobranchus ocellatus TaxID=259542 RepID=A0AAV3YPF7_9GAST|nr:hypothetical protein PoB_001042400 [Plakobranchus ocellatus]